MPQHGFILWQGDDAGAALQMVEAEAGDDGIEPGGEASPRVVLADVEPNPQKSLLHDVLRFVLVGQHLQRYREHHPLTPLNELSECVLVARLASADEDVVSLRHRFFMEVRLFMDLLSFVIRLKWIKVKMDGPFFAFHQENHYKDTSFYR